MKLLVCISTILILLHLAFYLYAQEDKITFNHYTHADGLSNNWVFSMLQDDRGFLWVGTRDGLNKFDGKDFRVYFHDENLPNTPGGNQIKCLVQDRAGMIWMGTENGVTSLDPLTDQFTPVIFNTATGKQISSCAINSLAIGSDSMLLWAGGQGLFFLEPGKKNLVPAPGNLNDSLFLGKDNIINDILTDGSRLWLATSAGIIMYNTNDLSWKKISYAGENDYLDGLEFITNLHFDASGTLWATTWGAGLLEADTIRKCIMNYYLADPGKKDAAHNILNGIAQTNYPDEEDILWISGISGGLSAFDMRTKTFKSYSSKDSDDPYHTYTECINVCFHPETGLWIGSRLGFSQYDLMQQMFREYMPLEISENGEDDFYYYSLIYADPLDTTGNTVWLGTNNRGLFIYNLQSGEIRRVNDDFGDLLKPEIYISALHRDEEGSLWIATLLNGMLKQGSDAGKPTQVNIRDQAGNEIKWINEFQEDLKDHSTLWIATDRGLFSFDKQTETVKKVAMAGSDHPYGNSSIYALFQQTNGTLWFLGNDALSGMEFLARLAPGSVNAEIIIGPAGEPDSNYLHMNDIACTPGGELFVTSYKGLYHFNTALKKPQLMKFVAENQDIRTYAEQILPDRQGNLWMLISDDLFLLEISTRQIHKLIFENLQKNVKLNLNENIITGDIMLGSWFRFYTVKTEGAFLSKETMPIYITGIRIGTDYYLGRAEDFTNSRIVLPFEKNNVTVEYTAINYRAGSFNQYAYKISGYDREWNFTGNESVSYKLPPGKYRFQLRAANASGIWDDEFVFTDIIIRPPFYRTWWFAALAGLLIASIIYSIYRLRINHLLRLQKMRDNISRDLHDDIGSSLTNIAIMNEMAKEETKRGGDPEKILNKSAEDIHEVISSLSDIVWNVNPAYDDLKYLLARMRRYASELLDNSEMEYTLDFPGSEQKVMMNMEQRRDFYLVFKEGLNNLIKYSAAHHAEITIEIRGKEINMMMMDDGKGFDPAAVIFGNGLKNMRQRAEAWGGSFVINSGRGQGTKIIFTMPVNK